MSDGVACERYFAFQPIKLADGRPAWMRFVYRITSRTAVWYQLDIPANAL